jgi:hypothetical protein
MTKIVACDQHTHAQAARGLECGTECHHRRELIAEMIRHDEGCEAEILDLPAQSGPIRARRGPGGIDAEPERTSQFPSFHEKKIRL